jgi:hypothetical protein
MQSFCLKCNHIEDKHAATEPRVCLDLDCSCDGFDADVYRTDYQDLLDKLQETRDKVKWLLENLKFLRNFGNKYFVLSYWKYVDGVTVINEASWGKLTDPESIRRAKQLLVADNPDKYGPFEPNIVEQKQLRQLAFEEFCTIGNQ